MNYTDYLQSQIKRLESVENYERKRDRAKKPEAKDYYTAGMKMQLQSGETFENYKQILQEYKDALVARKERIKGLYNEIKVVKRLKV